MQRSDSVSGVQAQPIGQQTTPSKVPPSLNTSRIPTSGTPLPRPGPPGSGAVTRFGSSSSFSGQLVSRNSFAGLPPASPSSPSPNSSGFSDGETLSGGSNPARTTPSGTKLGLEMSAAAASFRSGGYNRDSMHSLPGGNSTLASYSSAASSALQNNAGKDDNCLVTVRMRPPNYSELAEKIVWNADGEQKIRLDPIFADVNRRTHSEYVYDSVLQGSDNEEAYARSVKGMIPYLMDGYHVTVFAYGQTASGKTYTMTGMEDQPGIIPQAVDDVFEYIRMQHNDSKEYLVRVSYLEIYNEQIRDLLQPDATDLRILEDKRRGVYVSPLKEEIVTSAKQVLQVIQRGEINRHTGSTDYNEYSSRSHTIFQMVIESREQTTPKNSPLLANGKHSDGTVRVSQLNLIDLAGSEKAATDADRRKEGAYINKSLLTLGTVISRLTEAPKLAATPAGTSPGHIPYRDSKLTRILQSSLSGNAKISVICTISPTASSYEESNNTLKFAARVKHVVLNAKANRILDDKALIQKYRSEILELRKKLATIETVKDNELKVEKRRYEKQIIEEQMIRTTLKERIEYLQRMILTSSGMQARTLLEGGAPGGNFATSSSSIPQQASVSRKPSINDVSGDVETFQKVLDLKHTLTERDSVISGMQKEMGLLRTAVHKLSSVLDAVRRGDFGAAQAFANEIGSVQPYLDGIKRDEVATAAAKTENDGDVVTLTRVEYNKYLAESAIKDQKIMDLASRLTTFHDRSKSLESLVVQRDQLLAQRNLELRQLQGQAHSDSQFESMEPEEYTPASTPGRTPSEASPMRDRSSNYSMDSHLQQNGLMLAGLMTSLLKLEAPSELSLDDVEPPLESTSEENDDEDEEDQDQTF